MESLIIKKTKQTPEINFNAQSGVLEIKGRSIPENSFEFYTPVLSWIDQYIKKPNENTIIKVYLEYFNTSSSKFILEIFKKLQKIQNIDNKNILIEWYYDKNDEEMMETGKDYKDVTELPFEIIINE
ncbi:MAG: DUF1987 domain-containing protein [Bacteroidales bacterium]|nr:DUF1987 domain-containing protein [Bacteroidales bacterium]